MTMRRLTVNPRYEHLRAYIEQIPATMESQGTYVYGGRRNLIMRMTAPDGTALCVKRFQQPRGINRLVYSYGIRQPKGQRAYDYPARLLEKGIQTPEAVAYIEERNALHLLRQCYLVTRHCPYPHLLYEMGDATPDVYEPMARALAAFAAHMHDCQVLHLDFSPGNILWDYAADDPTGYVFAVVDINRMRFAPVTMSDGCRSFARLWGPKRFTELLVEEYARLRGFDPQACRKLAMEARRRFWTRYQKKREIEFKLEL